MLLPITDKNDQRSYLKWVQQSDGQSGSFQSVLNAQEEPHLATIRANAKRGSHYRKPSRSQIKQRQLDRDWKQKVLNNQERYNGLTRPIVPLKNHADEK